MQKTALILCGGKGTRLKELFPNTPKGLIPIEGIPIVERIIKQLTDFTVFINISEEEKNYFEYLHLPLLIENKRYGNAGAIKQFYRELGEDFLVIHCDVLSDINMNEIWREHQMIKSSVNNKVTMAVKNIGDTKSYGLILHDSIQKNLVVGFTRDRFINCGVYCMNKSVVDNINYGFQDFDNDLFPKLTMSRELYTYTHNGVWFDIGNKDFWEDYKND